MDFIMDLKIFGGRAWWLSKQFVGNPSTAPGSGWRCAQKPVQAGVIVISASYS